LDAPYRPAPPPVLPQRILDGRPGGGAGRCGIRVSGSKAPPPVTPDGRYIVVRGRLWRRADPSLSEERRAELVAELMHARRAVLDAADDAQKRAARARVHAAKVALGERGPVWWDDGAPDLNRHMARNTPYAAWHASLAGSTEHA
jgi:hypothetical protein